MLLQYLPDVQLSGGSVDGGVPGCKEGSVAAVGSLLFCVSLMGASDADAVDVSTAVTPSVPVPGLGDVPVTDLSVFIVDV